MVLDRRIAEGGRYPAVNVLRSLSRAAPGCNSEAENRLVRRAGAVLAFLSGLFLLRERVEGRIVFTTSLGIEDQAEADAVAVIGLVEEQDRFGELGAAYL